MTTSWGNLPPLPDTESGIAAIEREQITKPRPLQVENCILHHSSSMHLLHETTSFAGLPAELNSDVCKQVLCHSVAVIIAQFGFDSCMESCLCTLTDIAQHYLVNLVSIFRSVTDRCVGSDSAEHWCHYNEVLSAFMEIGGENLLTLQDFYHANKSHQHDRHQKERLKDFVRVWSPHFSGKGTLSAGCSSRVEEGGSDIHFPTEELDDVYYKDQLLPEVTDLEG